ncbi:MAG: heparinase II/III family protein, partial [bacterium]
MFLASESFRTINVRIFFLAFALILIAPLVPHAEERATRPNLVLSPGDVERIRRNIEEVGWMKDYFEGLKAGVDGWIERGVDIPKKGGEWSQNYVSPNSGRELVYNRDEPHRHLDPGTGKYLEGEVFDGAWREIAHKENIEIALRAGLLYQLTGDIKYAEFARSILIRYAKSYDKYPPHGGPAGLGRITAQSLGEARWLIGAASAFDLIADAPCMTERDREGIINRLLLPAAGHVEVFQFGIHNIQVWHSVSMLMAALIAEKKSLADYATDDLKRQIKKGIRPEGMWYETSVGYHFFATKPFATLAAVCRNRGLELCGEPELRNLFTAMPKLVMPDGKMPALNDATRGRTLHESLLGLVAARYAFDDPSLDGIIDAIGTEMRWKVDLQVFMYYVRPSTPVPEWKYPDTSVHMPGTGLTVLRRDGRYALLKYNPYSGGHDHPDKLSIIYYAGGRELFPSRGTIAYGHPLYRDWYRKTEAHNTIMVDGRQQHKAECEALDF